MNRTNTCIGYIYDKEVNGIEDYSYRYFFDNTPSNVARFICTNYKHKVVVTDDLDLLICSSVVGGYLDQAADKEYLVKELLPELARYQLNGEEPIPIDFEFDEKSGQFYERKENETIH